MPLIDDFRQAWRGLRNAPGFLAVAATVLALGLGATIFMYGVINTTIADAAAVPESASGSTWCWPSEPSQHDLYDDIHYLDYLEFKKRAAHLRGTSPASTTARWRSPATVCPSATAAASSPRTFDVLRHQAAARPRLRGERRSAGRGAPVILSYDLWRTRFNDDPDVIGKTVRVNSVARTIIGVAPEGIRLSRSASRCGFRWPST